MIDLGQIGKMFNNPLVLGAFILVILFVGGAFFYLIVRNVRGGFGKMGRPKQLIQHCMCKTSSNMFCLYRLKIDDEFVTDPNNESDYHLYPDALIPKYGSGELFLPLDPRSAVPLYLLEPDKRIPRVKEADTALTFIADLEDEKATNLARQKAEKGNTVEMQKFALLAVMVILLIIVIAILVTKIV